MQLRARIRSKLKSCKLQIWSSFWLTHAKVVRTIEARPFQEQRATANSERRMEILKRSQLGMRLSVNQFLFYITSI
jgi:hypothetical protein